MDGHTLGRNVSERDEGAEQRTGVTRHRSPNQI